MSWKSDLGRMSLGFFVIVGHVAGLYSSDLSGGIQKWVGLAQRSVVEPEGIF